MIDATEALDRRDEPVDDSAGPRMNPEHLRRISELLDEALVLEEAEQAAWLGRLQREDAGLGTTLRRLLARKATKEVDALLDRLPACALLSAGALAAGPRRSRP